jgi:hypothetical protein
MTPEQLELKVILDTNPVAWNNLTPDQKLLLRNTLRPEEDFTNDQRELLLNRWLPISIEQLGTIESLLPSQVRVQAIADVDDDLWIGADLLTDCMQEGDTYHAIASILATLPITLKSPEDFPVVGL